MTGERSGREGKTLSQRDPASPPIPGTWGHRGHRIRQDYQWTAVNLAGNGNVVPIPTLPTTTRWKGLIALLADNFHLHVSKNRMVPRQGDFPDRPYISASCGHLPPKWSLSVLSGPSFTFFCPNQLLSWYLHPNQLSHFPSPFPLPLPVSLPSRGNDWEDL